MLVPFFASLAIVAASSLEETFASFQIEEKVHFGHNFLQSFSFIIESKNS